MMHIYWPVYMSIGNVHNNVHRAQRGALVHIVDGDGAEFSFEVSS
jgi:Plavaka transposase